MIVLSYQKNFFIFNHIKIKKHGIRFKNRSYKHVE